MSSGSREEGEGLRAQSRTLIRPWDRREYDTEKDNGRIAENKQSVRGGGQDERGVMGRSSPHSPSTLLKEIVTSD